MRGAEDKWKETQEAQQTDDRGRDSPKGISRAYTDGGAGSIAATIRGKAAQMDGPYQQEPRLIGQASGRY